MKDRLLAVVALLAVATFGAVSVNAQVEVSPGVARISLIHGDVSTQRGDSGDWSAATLNQPIVTGDKVSTAESSRAEVQLDHANILRLGNRSQATVANLARTQIQVQIGEGLVDYSVFKGTEAEVEIDTPNASVHPAVKDGTYRIQVNSDHETVVMVRNGEADISTPQGSTSVKKGQVVTVRGTGDDTRYMIADAPSKDDWDSWNNDRDQLIRNAEGWRHTNQYYVGAEDLDAYGRWQTVPDYGSVWMPAVSYGWAPYRAGRWVWEPYWGWTWVSYEPWGWAPYHYGRWFVYGDRWAWWPGSVYGYRSYRPVWAPAYVSFFGFGGHSGFAFGFGSFGWLPTGPCDRFYPWYGRYRSHFNTVNITNVNVTNIYVRNGRGFDGFGPLHRGNRYSNLRLVTTDTRIRQAVSTVPADRFGTGRAAAAPVNHTIFRDGHVMKGNLPVVPTRETLSASNRPASPATLARGGQKERFFTKRQPIVRTQSFDNQANQVQQAIQRNGRFAPVSAGTRMETGAAAGRGAAPSNGAASNGQQGSAATTNQPISMPTRIARGQATAAGSGADTGRSTNTAPQENGWRRFGRGGASQNRPEGSAPATPETRSTSPAQPSNRQAENGQKGNARPAASDKGGWRRFTDANPGRSGGYVPSRDQTGNRDVQPSSSDNAGRSRNTSERNLGSRSPEAAPDRTEGWRHTSPQPRSAAPESRSATPESRATAPQSIDRGGAGNDEWRHVPSRNQTPSRDFGSRQDRTFTGRSTESRPPLNMSQPIVTPRASGGDRIGGGPRGGGSRAEPNRGGGHSVPAGGQGHHQAAENKRAGR